MHDAKPRIIAKSDIENEYIIKGIHLEGLRKAGDRLGFATKYYDDGIDDFINYIGIAENEVHEKCDFYLPPHL